MAIQLTRLEHGRGSNPLPGSNINSKNNMNNFKNAKAKNIRDIAASLSGKTVVYIAGKVTGLPYKEVVVKFHKAQIALEQAGYYVINPVALVHQDANWQHAMRICLSYLPFADYIHLLHDWQDSQGATLERDLATKLGIPSIEL